MRGDDIDPELSRIADIDLHAGAEASCASNLAVIWDRLRTRAPVTGIEPAAEALAYVDAVCTQLVEDCELELEVALRLDERLTALRASRDRSRSAER